MSDFQVKKNNIKLSDYNYQKDIENRILMAELTIFEVEVLKEILHSSLQIPIKQLACTLDVTENALIPVLDKLSKTKLLSRHDSLIVIDKEMRKYYESQILKFDDEFQPDMNFLQGLLSKVPVHALPNWYSIPASSQNIFNAIVESFLLTPKMYETYLHALKLPEEVMHGIMQDVFTAPEFKVCAKKLMNTYCLSREQFEGYMLFLEFSFICCLGYQRNGDIWEEIVNPFHEWKNFLVYEYETMPKSIKDTSAIQEQVIFGANTPTAQLHTAYRQAMQNVRQLLGSSSQYSDRDIIEVERSLQRIINLDWVYFDEFMSGFLATIGKSGTVTLQVKGKRWRYVLPIYSPEDLTFVKTVMFEGLAKAGIISIGKHKNRDCIRVTAFGRHSIEG